MNVLMLVVCSGSLLSSVSAEEKSKDVAKSFPSRIEYVGEDGSHPGQNNIYGSSNTVNRYGGLPVNYGGFPEIVRNRFHDSDGGSKDDTGGEGYKNDQSTGGSSYPGSNEPDETANGVFSNPFLGQRRRTYSTSPDYGTQDTGDQSEYGRPYYGGNYLPNYGSQRGIFSRPAVDQGYIYPARGTTGTGLRQPDGAYGTGMGNGYGTGMENGYGTGMGNGYGAYPGTFVNIPRSYYYPWDGTRGIYGQSPRSYEPDLYGYGQYPGLAYPGLGLDYGRLRQESRSHGSKADESVSRKGTGHPYPKTSPSAPSPKETSDGKAKSLRKEDP